MPETHVQPVALRDDATRILQLRAEQEASVSDERRALLLYEIAELSQRSGDEAGAARDLLTAVNLDERLREPLEKLVVIIERKKSFKNLGKLLDRLTKVADKPEERARAQTMLAAFLEDHENDLDGARAALEEAVSEQPDDAIAWLALCVLAAKMSNGELRGRALEARARLAEDPRWRALLLVDLAAAFLDSGDSARAIEVLDRAIQLKGPVTFRALDALRRAAVAAGREEVAARALEARATLSFRAIDDPATAQSFGVPWYERGAAPAADAWMRAAIAHRRAEDPAAAARMLDQAMAQLPAEPAIVHARLVLAEAAGDTAMTAELAAKELELGMTGSVAAGLELRIAEAAASSGDGPRALAALGRALAQDPGCVPARALTLDLLAGGHSPQDLASALEATAAEISDDASKGRYYLLAADAWARGARDVAGAKAALSQAGMYGCSPDVVARVGRLLASILEDAAWYEESTRRMLAAGAPPPEQAGLWFELARLRALRGDIAGARDACAHLAKVPGSDWLGHALSAYVIADGNAPPDTISLDALANAEVDPASARALRLVVALRSFGSDDDTAAQTLEKVFDEDPTDLVAATALVAAHREDAGGAAQVLRRAAEAAVDDEAAASFEIEAGLRQWRAGDRTTALLALGAAAERSPAAASALLAWALRAADPNSADARRRVLVAGAADAPAALELFALDVGKGEAWRALDGERDGTRGLVTARTLARALGDPENREAAVRELADLGATAQAIAAATTYVSALASSSGDAEALLSAAGLFAEGDPSLAPALERLGAAIASADVDGEISARRVVARRVGGPIARAVDASASLLAALNGDERQQLLPGAEPVTCLANLELAPPGCDPRRRAAAVAGTGAALGPEEAALVQAVAGWNHLAAGRAEHAMAAFRAYTEAHPAEVVGWDGLRAAADALGDRPASVEACAALGDLVHDNARGAELWEAASLALLDEFGDAAGGEAGLQRAVERDVNRFSAFDRLFRIVRARKDSAGLLALIEKRLAVAEAPEEIAKLFWERARVLREGGDREGALEALDNVTMLEADHVGALALSGEIYITLGRFAEAATNLAHLATLEAAPEKQRLMSGVAAVDIYERKLGDAKAALQTLVALHACGLSTAPVRERLARTAAALEDWPRAADVLEQLMHERDAKEGRVDAARLAMVIHRDRIGQPAKAAAAVEKLLSEAPADAEALDLVLSGIMPPEPTMRLLGAGRYAVVEELAGGPLDAEHVNRLARIAAAVEDASLRQATLGALVALGHGTREIDEELYTLDQRVARLPQIAIDEGELPHLLDPDDHGPVPDLMRALAPTFAQALGPGLEAFGVGKKERVKPSAGVPIRNEIAAWVGALGLGEFELYVGGPDPEAVHGVATSPISIVVGTAIQVPMRPAQRQLVARELFALRRGTTILRHRDSTDISALVVAACRLGGQELPAPQYAMLAEFERSLGRGIARKTKNLLPELVAPVAQYRQDPSAWYRAAVSSLDRLAAISAGDVSYVLCSPGGVRGQIGASDEARERAGRVLRFVLSPQYLELRQRLGMGLR